MKVAVRESWRGADCDETREIPRYIEGEAGGRDEGLICVVEDVPDLWALERGGSYRGRYHVLGGVMSAVDGITPDDLNIPSLISRIDAGGVREVILALNATFEGQNTAHYVADQLVGKGVQITYLAHGVPVGGELDHLDDGTLAAALRARRTSE